jgi:hypothetical protein
MMDITCNLMIVLNANKYALNVNHIHYVMNV